MGLGTSTFSTGGGHWTDEIGEDKMCDKGAIEMALEEGAPGQGLIPRKVVTSCGDRLREDLASPVCGLRNMKGSGRNRNGMSKNLQVWRNGV